ncbi:MAG: glycosyltransferase family 2 protein [Bacilli bacterium]|nr:glycosyltransferase family 2 protein [Bacilli bacterium]
MSKIGIVILNYNDYKETKEYVTRIRGYRSLDEIVIVDNNSSDSSYENLKRMEKKNITVLKTDDNKGYAYGNNMGIKFLKDRVDYIIISNPDIVVDESVIRKLRKDLDENPDISIVAPIISQNGQVLKGRRLPKVIDEIGLNLNYFHRMVETNLTYDEKRYSSELTRVDVISGCFFMARREDLNLVGNFDDNTFLFYEENILATKLKNINKKTYIDNGVMVLHNESVTINKTMASIKKYKILKDSQKYFVKYYLHANAFELFVLRFVYRISLIVAYIIYFIHKIFKKKK